MKKDPDSTDESFPLEDLGEDARDTESPPEPPPEFRGGEVIEVDEDPDGYDDPDD